MHQEKIILLVEATVQPAYRDEVVAAAQAALADTLREPGCLAFFQTVDTAEPDKLVFFEVFASEAAHQAHLAQDYTKRVFATLEGKLAGAPRITHLRQLG